MRINISEYFETFGNEIYATAIENNISTVVADIFKTAYCNVFSEYGAKGETYIYDGDDLQDTVGTLTAVHKGITRNLTYILSKIDENGDFEMLTNPKDVYTVSGNSDNAGMGEASPINATTDFVTGGIVTPNAKSINKSQYGATHNRDNYDIRVRGFYEQIIRDNNLYAVVRKHFIQLVYEHNTVF